MSSDGLQNLTEDQLSAMVPPEPHDRFDQELVGWFAQHGGVWSGTASELLAAVTTRVEIASNFWPRSTREIYAHLESHKQALRSLGVAVSLPRGFPRMISLRSCHDKEPARKPPAGASGINETFSQDISVAQLDADGDNSESVCDNTAEELFAMLNLVVNLQVRSGSHNIGNSNRPGAAPASRLVHATRDQAPGEAVWAESGSRRLLGHVVQKFLSLLTRKNLKEP